VSAPPRCRLAAGGSVDLGDLVRAEDGGAPRWRTRARLAWRQDRLVVTFECEDDDAWGTLTRRDDPLWREEVVELFLAPGAGVPERYFELELSPRGTIFDARVRSPHGDRRGLEVDPSWDCPELAARVAPTGRGDGWRAELSLPWRALAPPPLPKRWRLNLFRIERPRAGGAAEHSAWSPTGVVPADFHRPACFGHLELEAGDESERARRTCDDPVDSV